MNKEMSLLFRAIPLMMGAICLAYGLYIWNRGPTPDNVVSGHVVTFLTAICIALFSTAATIIRQLTDTYGPGYRAALPVLGYAAGIIAVICGLTFVARIPHADGFVAGHVVFGIGLITCCVATVAASSTKFVLIPRNSKAAPDTKPDNAFNEGTATILLAVPIICTVVGLAWGFALLTKQHSGSEFMVAGHVLVGLSLVCGSLIALVASVLRQIQNTYGDREHSSWPLLVAVLGGINSLWGLTVLVSGDDPARLAPGWVLIGLCIVCWSILSKVLLLALVWRRSFPLADRIPLIPVMTALSCLFIAGFLFEAGLDEPAYYVPARIMVGLGAVCFTLFSIVSILESGTSGGD